MAKTGKRYTEEQIIGILKEAAAAKAVGDVIRRHGISAHTYYRWKSKYAGMDVADARRLKQLEDENRRLKQLVAQQALKDRNSHMRGAASTPVPAPPLQLECPCLSRPQPIASPGTLRGGPW